ncbi:unnamed protein product, partial [Brachionus calyciflorus]
MKYFKDISVIIDPYLYIGGDFLNRNPEYLQCLGFTHILNVADSICPNECLIYSLRQYKHITAKDSLDYYIRHHFDEAFQVIDHARLTNGKILVHCKKGKSRSATIIIAYLMSRYNWSFSYAYWFVKSRRMNINPNDNFLRLLYEFDNELNRC